MISLSREGKIAVHSLMKQNHLIRNKVSVEVSDFPHVSTSPNANSVFIASRKKIFIYDVKKRSIIETISVKSEIDGIQMHIDEKTLITYHRNNQLRTWDLFNGKLTPKDSLSLNSSVLASESSGKNTFLLCTSDGDFLEYSFLNNTTTKLDIPKEFIDGKVLRMKKQPHGNLVAFSLSNFTMLLYDLTKCETLEVLEFDSEIRHFEFSQKGDQLFIADFNSVKIWLAQQGKFDNKVLVSNELPVNNLTINESIEYIVVSDNNNEITIWDKNSLIQIGPSIGGFISNPQFVALVEEGAALTLFDARYEQGHYFLDIYELSLNFEELNKKVKYILNQTSKPRIQYGADLKEKTESK